MNFFARQRQILKEMDQKWRVSEFVVSYANWGDRGRMRGSSVHADGVLHRSTCHTLGEARREFADYPSHVYPTTIEKFTETANRVGVGNQYRVCKACCKDITVVGRNMKVTEKI